MPIKDSMPETSNGKITSFCCLSNAEKPARKSQHSADEKSAQVSINAVTVIPLIQLQPVQEGIEHISVLCEDKNSAKCHFCDERCDKVHNDCTRLKIVSRGNVICLQILGRV